MTTLKLSNRNLTSLDGIDLTGIIGLDCGKNNLSSLPPLPDTLEKLYCDGNKLALLPPLPDTLETLYCDGNKLALLPPLPVGLKVLMCNHNILTSLSSLPNSLAILDCSNNQLSSLPILPISLISLRCKNNLIVKTYIDDIKLQQHNQMRTDIGWNNVGMIRREKEVRDKWKIWQYRLDGEKYKQAESAIK